MSCMSRLRVAAWGVAIAAYVFMALAAVDAGGVMEWIPLGLRPLVALALLAPATVGLLIANRQPRNVIAWILLLGSFALTLQVPLGFLESEGWRLQMDRALWPLLYAWPIAVAFVFPTGRLLSPRWRWIAALAALDWALFVALGLFDPAPFYGDDASVPNPMAGNRLGELASGLWVPLWFGMLGTLVAGSVAIWLRLRRSTGTERLQTKWLAWATVMIPVGLFMCGVTSFVFGDSILDYILFTFLLVMEVAVAASVGIAVLKYRLYDIDRIVNRTLVYVSLTFLLLSAYVAITVGLGVLVGGDSPGVVAAATLAVALAFRPLRARIQDLVDRRYRKARFEGVRLVRAFEDRVRDGVRAPEEIGSVLADALQDPLAELLFWIPGLDAYSDATGDTVPEPPRDARAWREIRREDARTAVLLHDPALLERLDLLDGVLGAAALSIEMARLTVEVRLQLAEVEASRSRIVEAGYEERRRLERDLHDGAQQRLVSLGVQLRRLQLTLPRESQILSPALDQIVAEVGAAIGDLRQIAAGVRPARLDEGLAAALRDLARTSPVPVEVDAPDERVAASVEAAAYFVACEALTNAVKHGSPSKVAVHAVRENGTLHVVVSDDGVGGATVDAGPGLRGFVIASRRTVGRSTS